MISIPVTSIPQILCGSKITYCSSSGGLVLEDCDDATPPQRELMNELNAVFHQAIEDALDAGCLALQNSIGVQSGDFASMFFCGGRSKDAVLEAFADYYLAELSELIGSDHVETDFLTSL